MKATLDLIDENTWIISDLHLGHNRIMRFEPGRAEAMKADGHDNHEDWLVKKWNDKVQPGDTVLCLGDFAFNGVANYSKILNGNKILVLGNHDGKPKDQKYQEWTVIDGIYLRGDVSAKLLGYEYDPMLSAILIDINDTRYLFSHYPVFDDNQYDRTNPKIVPRMEALEVIYKHFECEYSVHGHTHSKESTFKDSINVCAEHLEFEPQRLGDILSLPIN